jgi:hypothetical protein
MKLIKLALITVVASTFSLAAFAEDNTAAPTTAPTTTTTSTTTDTAKTESKKGQKVAANKVPVKQAREACLKDNPELKGKDLSKCIREKRNAK